MKSPEKRAAKEANAANIHHGTSIKETALVYGLTIDTLYYYEKIGLVIPARNPVNGYRIYRGDDFFKLNLITELQSMGFTLSQIGEYFANHSFSSTISLMNDELARIDSRIEALNAKKDSVFDSMQQYAKAMAKARQEEIEIRHIAQRPCLLVTNDAPRYDLVPHAFAMCAKRHGMNLGALHTTPCYLVDTEKPLPGIGCFEPEAILLCSEKLPCKPDYEIAAGLYATCTFQGSFREIQRHYEDICAYIASQGYEERPGALEFCLIGEYESNDQSEYVSRIEIPVSEIN